MAVTLKDIAHKTGLSIPTVSEVLRDDPNSRLSSDTRQRVLRAAQELGYSRNIYAKVLSTGKSRLIGLLMDSLRIEVSLSKLQAIDQMIQNRSYTTATRNTGGVPEIEIHTLEEFVGRMVEGVIAVHGLLIPAYDAVRSLMDKGIPVVSIEPVIGLDVDYVTVDRKHGAHIATKHLLEAGHTKIALLHGPVGFTANERILGYEATLREHGVEVDEKLMTPYSGSGAPECGYDAMKVLLSRDAGLTAVICNNDNLAFGAMKAIFEAGLKIPDDVAVVGFDDIALSAFAPVPLTTVKQPVDEIAEIAADLLFKRINRTDADIPVQKISVKPSLVVRGSSVRC